MDADSRRAVLVFVGLVALLVIPVGFWQVRERTRPELLEVRVVTATAADPAFRDGTRVVGPDEAVTIALALRVKPFARPAYWLAAGERLELGGVEVERVRVGPWPDEDRALRVFWFTVESAGLGGELEADNAASRVAYRTFLAPELGRGMVASGQPEAHNDDYLTPDPEAIPTRAGTLRLYARVEVVAAPDALHAEQAVASPGAKALFDPGLTTIRRRAVLPAPLRPEVGELFLLPDLEPGDAARREAVEAVLGRPFAELVERRLATSSASFAAVALAGRPALDPDGGERPGPVTLANGALALNGRRLRWGDEVAPGRALVNGRHWIVLLADDGDGVLDLGDRVAHCWRRPPAVTSLGGAVGADTGSFELVAHAR